MQRARPRRGALRHRLPRDDDRRRRMTRTVVVLAGGLGTRVAHLTGPGRPEGAAAGRTGGRSSTTSSPSSSRAAPTRSCCSSATTPDVFGPHLRDAHGRTFDATCVASTTARSSSAPAARSGARSTGSRRFWVTYGDTLLDVPMAPVERFADPDRRARRHDRARERRPTGRRATSRCATIASSRTRRARHRARTASSTTGCCSSAATRSPRRARSRASISATSCASEIEPRASRRLGRHRAFPRHRHRGARGARPTSGRATSALWDRLQERIRASVSEPAIFLDRDGVIVESRRARPAVDAAGVGRRRRDPPRRRRRPRSLRAAGYAPGRRDQPARRRARVDHTRRRRRDQRALRATRCRSTRSTCASTTVPSAHAASPGPGMLLDAARDLDLDLAASWLIGDRWVDIAAGAAAGVRTILLERAWSWAATSSGAPAEALAADRTVASVPAAVEVILASTPR